MHCVDWMPTLSRVIGYEPDESLRRQWDGMDVCDFLTGTKEPTRQRELYWVWGGPSRKIALRHGDWKLLRNGREAPWELFHLAEDPCETEDLAARYPDKVRDLKRRIRAQAARDVNTDPKLGPVD